ncbi:hypothetical protein LCGC14_0813720 [marine sediment metagenome]|uniref:Uncharacterized protein n=1 Tax=marine sediment metagenome TaxID=412755 RepID=A0A0F9PKY1_9ZZZZ
MAKPVKFEGYNTTFVADGCGDLPAYAHGRVSDEQVVTCWELSGEELMEILRTKRVWLRVWGDAHPPVEVTGVDPFALPGEVTEDGQPGKEDRTMDDSLSELQVVAKKYNRLGAFIHGRYVVIIKANDITVMDAMEIEELTT